MSRPRLTLVANVRPTRGCPDCRSSLLEPVYGGRGKLGRCRRCGWTGPLAGPGGAAH